MKNINNIRKKHVKRRSKKIGKCLAVFAAAVIPILILAGTLLLPPQFGNTFMGEMADKYKRLHSIEKPKIILVGGSSMAFGMDSQKLEQYMDRPVVNFGLYASLGTKVMLNLSRHGIEVGDIIVIAPEMNEQTMSLYFNAEAMWQAADSNYKMLLDLDKDNWENMLGGFWNYAGSKIKYFREGAPNPNGVYNHSSFNEYGDIAYERSSNQMAAGYDTSMTISLSEDMIDPEFILYLNEYISYAKKKNAKVYFSFPPMNKAALAKDTTDESIYAFFQYLSKQIHCLEISNINEYIFDAKYFYDSNFHLNDTGVQIRTDLLAQDLYRAEGITENVAITYPDVITEKKDSETPKGQAVQPDETDWTAYFTYKEFYSVSNELIGYVITGLSEQGKQITDLTIPAVYQGLPVLSIEANTFKDSQVLTDIRIYSNIKSIVSGAFADCPALTGLHIYNEDESTMTVDQLHLFDGSVNEIILYFYSRESYLSYATGYFWSEYSRNMQLVEQ